MSTTKDYTEMVQGTITALEGLPQTVPAGAGENIEQWIETTRGAGLTEVADELQALHGHIGTGNGAGIADCLSKLGSMTTAGAGGMAKLEELGHRLTSLSSELKAAV
jgi:hypothetical protein